jgi:hypothetical protein
LAGARHPRDIARVLRDRAKRPRFYNHMSASSVRARIPKAVWDGYYKFCFDRNPWDKVVSFYFWVNRRKATCSEDGINTYVETYRDRGTVDQALPSDWARYADGDRIIVDDVFDYADLSGGLAEALRRAGVSERVVAETKIGQEKTSVRKARSFAFTPRADAIVREVFHHEIATLPFCRAPAAGLTVA